MGGRQRTGAASKTVESLAEGGIESCHVSGVDDPALLGASQSVSEPSLCAVHETTLDGQRSPLTVLDHLSDEQVRPSE